MTTVRIPSKLYFDLWSRGNSIQGLSGDKLIAVYSIIKSSRDKEIKYYAYKSKNNKTVSGFSLLRAQTVLNLQVIEKYVSVLIEMGLCFIDKNGDFVLLGGERIKELYNSYKLVPIVVGKNLNETATNCIKVRLCSKRDEQQTMIAKKKYRSEIISHGGRLAQYFERTFTDLKIVDNTVLSNQGFACLKDGQMDKKSKGHYWKKKLKAAGIIKTKRVFTVICKMSKSDFIQAKKYGKIYENHFQWKDGYLYEEQVSQYSIMEKGVVAPIIVVKPVEVVKAKKPLVPSIDFLGWWEKQPINTAMTKMVLK